MQANMTRINAIIARYPPNYKASAVIPVLDLVQQMNGGWLSLTAMNKVAQILEMPEIRVYEVRRGMARGVWVVAHSRWSFWPLLASSPYCVWMRSLCHH